MENKTSKKSEAHKPETKKSAPEFSAEMIKGELSNVSKDGVIDAVKKAIDVISMKDDAMKSVSMNQKSEVYAALIFLLPVVLISLFFLISTPYFVFNYFIYMFLIPVAAFASTGFVASIVADKGFKTKVSVRPLFRLNKMLNFGMF
jgi:hypothetical protein